MITLATAQLLWRGRRGYVDKLKVGKRATPSGALYSRRRDAPLTAKAGQAYEVIAIRIKHTKIKAENALTRGLQRNALSIEPSMGGAVRGR